MSRLKPLFDGRNGRTICVPRLLKLRSCHFAIVLKIRTRTNGLVACRTQAHIFCGKTIGGIGGAPLLFHDERLIPGIGKNSHTLKRMARWRQKLQTKTAIVRQVGHLQKDAMDAGRELDGITEITLANTATRGIAAKFSPIKPQPMTVISADGYLGPCLAFDFNIDSRIEDKVIVNGRKKPVRHAAPIGEIVSSPGCVKCLVFLEAPFISGTDFGNQFPFVSDKDTRLFLACTRRNITFAIEKVDIQTRAPLINNGIWPRTANQP